ncbi:hypothetical protein RB601_003085 [Gaeumannomyces tritici]
MEGETSAAEIAIQPGQLASNLNGQSYVHGIPLNYTIGIELNVLKAGSKLFGARGGNSSFPGLLPSPEELDPKPDGNSAQGYIWVGMVPSHGILANYNAAVGAKAEGTTSTSAKKGRRPGAGGGGLLPPIDNDPNALRVVVNKSTKNLQFYKLTTRDASTNLCIKETLPKEHVFFFPSFLDPEVRGVKARKTALSDEIDKRANGTGPGTTPQSKRPKAAAPTAKTPGPGKVDKSSAKPNPPKTPTRHVVEKSTGPASSQSSTVQKENQTPGKIPKDKASGYQNTQIAQPKNSSPARKEAAIALQSSVNGAQPRAIAPPTAPARQEMVENRRPQNYNIPGWLDAPLEHAPHHPVETPSTVTIIADDASPTSGYTSRARKSAPDFAETPCRPHQPGRHPSQRPPSNPPSSTKTPLGEGLCNNHAYKQNMARNPASSWAAGTTGSMQPTKTAYGEGMASDSTSSWASGPPGNRQPTNNAYGKDTVLYPVPPWPSGAASDIYSSNNNHASNHGNDYANRANYANGYAGGYVNSYTNSYANNFANNNLANNHTFNYANRAANNVHEPDIVDFQMHPPAFGAHRIMQASDGGYGQAEFHHGGSDSNQYLGADAVAGLPAPGAHNLNGGIAGGTSTGFHKSLAGNDTGFPPGYEDVDMQHYKTPSQCNSLLVQCGAETDCPQQQDSHRVPSQRPLQNAGHSWRHVNSGGSHRNHANPQLGWGGVRKPGTRGMHRRVGVPREDPIKMLLDMAMELKANNKACIINQLAAIAQSLSNNDAFINLDGCIGAHFRCPAGELTPEAVGPLYEQFMKMFPDLRGDFAVAEFGFMLNGIREAKLMIEFKRIRQFVWAFVGDVRARIASDPAFSSSYRGPPKIAKEEAKKMAENAHDRAGCIVPSPYDAAKFACIGQQHMNMNSPDDEDASTIYMSATTASAIGEEDQNAQ